MSDGPDNVTSLLERLQKPATISPPLAPPRDWRHPHKLSERVTRKAQERALADGAQMYSIHVHDILAVLDEYQAETEQALARVQQDRGPA